MTKNRLALYKTLRVVISLFLIAIGAVLILLGATGTLGNLLANVGLALIVTGIVATFEELVLSRLEQGETADLLADRVCERLHDSPLQAVGIRLVSPIRKGYAGYYSWAINTEPQTLFFAGRSVLHRVDADFRLRGLGRAEQVIARRLRQGARLRVLLLDPRSDLMARLAREEGQTEVELLSDIATSIGICERLYDEIRDNVFTAASLDVRLYDEIPYFAYHAVDDDVVLGFYFSSSYGRAAAAYQCVDEHTKAFFEGHFESIFDRSRDAALLQILRNNTKASLSHSLLVDLKEALIYRLGEEHALGHLADQPC